MDPVGVVVGRFRLVRELGSGGMGAVYEAEDLDRGAKVALKMLKRLDAESLLRFKNEFRSLQGLAHPNLVSLGELLEDAGRWFFTMELVRGVDFVAWSTARRKTPEDDTPVGRPRWDEARLRQAIGQLAMGLTALHRAGKVHRDVKPSNVLVVDKGARRGRVVLLDFGLVTGAELDLSAFERQRIVGTVGFMAPEQAGASGSPVGPAADWYAVGALLYYTLAGRLPHVGPVDDVLARKLRDEPLPVSAFVPDVPGDLEALCRDLLQIDPGRRPPAEEILARLGVLDDDQAEVAPRGFVGRREELAELSGALGRVRGGAPVTVLLHGESGVGKTALAREFLAQLPEGPLVLRGRCYERESVPFKAIDPLIDALTQALAARSDEEVRALLPPQASLPARVFPALRRVPAFADAAQHAPPPLDPHDQRRALFAALRELLARLAATQPLVLLIDDLQWADADSLALLEALLAPPDAPPLLLLATVRPEALARVARRLAGELLPIGVGKLAAKDAHALVAQLAGDTSVDADAVVRDAEGLPLFLEALTRHRVAFGESAARLEDALWGRIARQTAPARRLVEVLAVAGGPLPLELAERAAELAENEIMAAVPALGAAHLVRAAGLRRGALLELEHDRLRESVLAHLSVETVRARHLALARALEGIREADPEALATSWAAAGDRERAARYALEAADRAMRAFAFDRAARLYEMAKGPGIAAKLGDALACAGRGAEAAEVYLRAAAESDPDAALELRKKAAESLLKAGHIDRGLDLLTAVMRELGVTLPGSPRAALFTYLRFRVALRLRGLGLRLRRPADVAPTDLLRVDAYSTAAACFNMTDNIVGKALGARALSLALRCGEPTRLAVALAVDATAVSSTGARGEARGRREYELSEELAVRSGDPFAIAYARGLRSFHDYFNGRFRTARDRALLGEQLFRETGRPATYEIASLGIVSLNSMAYLGELRELGREVATRLAEQRGRDNRYAACGVRTGLGHLLWLTRDDADGLEKDVGEAMREWSARGFHLQHYQELIALATADLYRGDVRAAERRMEERSAALRGSLLLHVQIIRVAVAGLLGRIAVMAGRAGDARKQARALQREGTAFALALAEGIRAGIEPDAPRHAERALRLYDAAEMALHRAVWQERLGALVGGVRGEELRRLAADWFRREGVKRPERIVATFAP